MMLFLTVSSYVLAQEAIPKREFKLGVSESSIELIPGQTTSLDVNIYRSKSYTDKEISLVVNSLPKGLYVEFEEQKTKSNQVALTIKSDETMVAGKYTLLLQGKSTRVSKGISFSITVKEKGITKN